MSLRTAQLFVTAAVLGALPQTVSAQPRVLVSTDIGGSDPDDFQSMVHFLVYTDMVTVEGLVSSPPDAGRASDIETTLVAYETDYPNLITWGSYPPVADLRAMTKQGATDSGAPGDGRATEGSDWIIERARAEARALWVLVWGSITDVAQAVYDADADGSPINAQIRIYSIGSWNTRQDEASRDYLYDNHPDLWWIENDTTFRGMYTGGDQSGEWNNTSFTTTNVDGHGALGNLFDEMMTTIKMGDTPSVLYMISPLVGGPGSHRDPTAESWGGAFVATDHGDHYWHDNMDPGLMEEGWTEFWGAKTVNQWRVDYLLDWRDRMDRCADENPAPIDITVAITSPADGGRFDLGDDITIDVTATAVGTTVSEVSFVAGETTLGTDDTFHGDGEFALTWSGAEAGTHVLEVTATAGDTTASSETITVHVDDGTGCDGGSCDSGAGDGGPDDGGLDDSGLDGSYDGGSTSDGSSDSGQDGGATDGAADGSPVVQEGGCTCTAAKSPQGLPSWLRHVARLFF